MTVRTLFLCVLVAFLGGCASWGENTFRRQNAVDQRIVSAIQSTKDPKKVDALYTSEQELVVACNFLNSQAAAEMEGRETPTSFWENLFAPVLIFWCSMRTDKVEASLPKEPPRTQPPPVQALASPTS